MARFSRGGWAVLAPGLLLVACNAIWGIDQPVPAEDGAAPDGAREAGPGDAGTDRTLADARTDRTSGDARVDRTSGDARVDRSSGDVTTDRAPEDAADRTVADSEASMDVVNDTRVADAPVLFNGVCEGGAVITIAPNQATPFAIAADDGGVYWLSLTGLWVDRFGAAPTLAGPAEFDADLPVGEVAVSGGTIVWAQDDRIETCAAAGGCVPTRLLFDTSPIAEPYVASNGTQVAWSAYTGKLETCAIGTVGTCRSEVLDPSVSASAVVIDDTYVYWSAGAPGIFSCPIDGGCSGAPHTVVALDGGAGAIALHDHTMFWVVENTLDEILECPLAGGTCAGEAGAVVGGASTQATRLAVDGDGYLYFLGADTFVARVPLEGGPYDAASVEHLYTRGGRTLVGLALAGNCVFFAEGEPDGSVLAHAK
jgi:hypothetical protein